MIFFSLVSHVLEAVGLLGLAGGFLTLPFRDGRKFVLLLSPMCGLLTLPPMTSLIYSMNKTTLSQATLIALALCVGLTILTSVRWRPLQQDVFTSLILTLFIAPVATVVFCASTITAGSQSILYIDGSDHGGYAHVADWLLSHTIGLAPIAAPERPYESWPAFIFTQDTRLSSFVALAMMAALNQSSGLFAYDSACAVVFSIACLSVAAAFARSRFSIIVLALCLLSTTWFELGRDGYFGKLLAYPSCLFLLGLFMSSYRKMSPEKLAVLILLTIGISTLHSGVITAFFLAAIGGIYLCGQALLERTERQGGVVQNFLCLGGIVAVALASVGMLSRPLIMPLGPGQFSQSWASLLPHLLEIQNPTREYVPISYLWVSVGSALAMFFQAALIVLAFLRRSATAIACAFGPTLIFLGLFGLDVMGGFASRYAAYQFSSIIVSYALCATVWLADDEESGKRRIQQIVLIVALGAASIIVRVPRLMKSFDTYVFNPPRTQIFELAEFDKLVSVIGNQTVLADIRDDLNLIAVLVELGRRGVDIQWSTESWKLAVGYRNWAPPNYVTPATLRIDDQHDQVDGRQYLYQGVQYRLSRLP
jgi:hypothetical protein